MKILITGANGLLGQKLVELLEQESSVTTIATGRGANRNNSGSYIYETMDITDAEAVSHIIQKHQPEAVIHTAAMTNVDQCEQEQAGCWKQNVEAVQNLVSACEQTSSFLLHLSTDFIFDGEEGPYDEEGTPNPISYYGESKLASEKILFDSSLNWSIARTVLVYGIVQDMSRSNIILWVKESLEDRKDIKVVNDQLRSPTLAEDLAMGCWLIVKNKAQGIFNIAGKDLLTPYDMACKTAEFFNLQTDTIQEADGSIFTQPAKRPPKTGLIIDKAKEELGYNPRSFKEGIAIVSEQVAAANN